MPRSSQLQSSANLSRSLQRDLASYALVASAAGVGVLALAEPAAAQIIYTPAHQQIRSKQEILIDLNHDGITDMTVREIPCSLGTYFPANSLQAVPAISGGVIIRSGAAALPAGKRIGSRSFFYGNPIAMLAQTDYGVYYAGSWAFAPPSYLGIQFSINGETHYGWARLNVQYNFYGRDIDVLLSGYAYETQSNTAIRAGDTGSNTSYVEQVKAPASMHRREPKKALTLGALALGAPLLPRCTY